jgi:hypothetical protein
VYYTFFSVVVVVVVVGGVRRVGLVAKVAAVDTRGALVTVFLVAVVVDGGVVVLTFFWIGSDLREPADEIIGVVVSLRRALAAVGAVNLETNDRVEPVAFFGFSSVSVVKGGAGTFFVASNATLGTRTGFVLVAFSFDVATTGFFVVVVGGTVIDFGLVVVVEGFFKVAIFLLSSEGGRTVVVGCLFTGALGLSSFFLLLTEEETLFDGFVIVSPFLTFSLLFFSSVVLWLELLVTLEFSDNN